MFEQIALGKWAEGRRLPTETQMCEMYQVSRPVVREALAHLRADGLIVSRQGSGSYVDRRPDTHFLKFAPVGNIAELLRCFEFRAAFEGDAAALAALRRSGEDIALIKEKIDDLARHREPAEEGIRADFEFHLAISMSSRNEFFVTTMRSLQPQIQYGMNLARNLSLLKTEIDRVAQVQEEHLVIFRAIRDGNADLARAAMRAHIENTRQRVLGEEIPAPGNERPIRRNATPRKTQ